MNRNAAISLQIETLRRVREQSQERGAMRLREPMTMEEAKWLMGYNAPELLRELQNQKPE